MQSESNDPFEQLKPDLRPGEVLLWVEQSWRDPKVVEDMWQIKALGLAAFSLPIVFAILAWKNRQFQNLLVYLLVVCSLPVAIFGFFMMFPPRDRWMEYRERQTWYAVTNQRVMSVQIVPVRRVESMELSPTLRADILGSRYDFGTIEFSDPDNAMYSDFVEEITDSYCHSLVFPGVSRPDLAKLYVEQEQAALHGW